MRLLICISALMLSACISNPVNESTASVDPNAKKVRIDSRLLEKCENFTDKLETGKEEEIVDWSKRALTNASDCRKAQHQLVDQVKETFKLDVQ